MLYHAGMDEHQQQGGARTGLIAFILLLPVFYSLSIGPAALLYTNGPSEMKTMIEYVYKPVEMMCDFPWFERLVEKYVGLWI